nr:serine/threonine-protein phosphatase 6 regulatory ankyrin repeat subunit C-like isoform X2 [Halyomorpha halys]
MCETCIDSERKMKSLKTWIVLCCVLSVFEFSVGDRKTPNFEEPDSNDTSDSGEARREELVSALQKGNIPIVRKLIEEGVLEEYYHGIYDKKESITLKKIKEKVAALSHLLHLQLASIPANSYATRYPSNKRLFNVTLIPGTDLSVRLLVNLTTVKNESLAKEGNAPLHLICSLPDVEPETVKVFLDFGTFEVDTWDESNHITALIIAAARGNLDLVMFLVENGADINNFVPTSLNSSVVIDHLYYYIQIFTRKPVFVSDIKIPLSAVAAAAYENQPEILRYLLENGGDVNNQGHGWFVLFGPTYNGDAEVVEILFKNGMDVNNHGPFGSTALHRVAETGNIDMAKLFLMYGANSNLTNNFGWTPLHVAALLGDNNTKPMVELLLDSGCDVNALTDGGFSPLNLVEAGSNLNFLNYLVKNSDSLKFDKNRNFVESEHLEGQTEALQILLNHGAELDHQDDILGWTALHWAAANGNIRGAKLLVREYGASTTIKSKMGMTPFRTAKHFGRKGVSEYFSSGINLVE